MEELLERLQSLRFDNRNVDCHYFVPDAALFDMMTTSQVEGCLRHLNIPPYELKTLADDIMRGGRKCFAILLLMQKGEIIRDFITHDNLLHVSPDDRLPFTSEVLANLFKVTQNNPLVLTFIEKQWDFATPTLSRHLLSRDLKPEAILPYLQEEEAGNSSMGRVIKVTLHPKSHLLPCKDNKVIRKEILCKGKSDEVALKKELRNLSLLACIRHPNIIELYCSYFYKGFFNLIFPVAEGGSLETVLEGPRNSKWPVSDSEMLVAVSDLASAIDSLHNFESKSLDVKLTGCHHDLAPRNILVQGQTLLLADFGLSTLRCPEEGSLTMYKNVRGSYVAPEGQFRRDDRIVPGQISRPGDIWSFGCILLEIFTYMTGDHTGLAAFREAREFHIAPDSIWFRFHRGRTTPSPQVAAQMERLLESDRLYVSHAVRLVQRMLALNPKERPKSLEVLMNLRGIAVLCLANTIRSVLSEITTDASGIDYVLESLRFLSWISAFEKLVQDIAAGDYNGNDLDFSTTIQSLKGFQQTLQVTKDRNLRSDHQELPVLRWESNKLIEALPGSYRKRARTSLVEYVLESDHVEKLLDLQQEKNIEDGDYLGILLAVKHLTRLAEEGRLVDRPDLLLTDVSFTTKSDIGPHTFAVEGENREEKVIIEWLRYEGHWADTTIGTELRGRLVSIAALLNSDYTSRLPGTLRCKGIEHDTARRAFGFVYELPLSTVRPVTLNELLVTRSPENSHGRKYRPFLEDRFRLARSLCHSLYKFHQLGWLHRNIHSKNIVFVLSEGTEDTAAARDPYFLGFSGSRQIKLDAFTRGADAHGKLRNYHHPAYFCQRDRYREEFDYYSIGMILLEVGLWNSLSRITGSRDFNGATDEVFRQMVIDRSVPQLGLTMGSRYMQAVLTCLRGDFETQHGTRAEFVEAFQSQVLDRIVSFE